MGEADTGGDERREHERFDVAQTFNVKFGDVEKLRKVFVRDISEGGMFLRTKKPRPNGTKVRVVLKLPDGAQFPLDGEIVYARTKGKAPGNGVKFTKMRESIKMLLGQYIERLAKKAATETEQKTVQAATAAPEPAAEPPVEPAAPTPAGAPAPPPTHSLRKPDSVPSEGLSDGGRYDEIFLQIESDLTEIERQFHGSPYDVVGVEVRATEAQIAETVAARAEEFDPSGYETRLPIYLWERMSNAVEMIKSAGRILQDPKSRAEIDFELNLLVPLTPTPEVQDAFRDILAERRSQASDKQKADFSRAASRRTLAEAMEESGNKGAAAFLYRVALLYDPYDHEVRQVLATLENVHPKD